jgi:hypothetical protein
MHERYECRSICEALMRVGMSRVEDDMDSGYVQQPGMVTVPDCMGYGRHDPQQPQ